MIKEIKTYLDAQAEVGLPLETAQKILYKKPIGTNQPTQYIYFLGGSKVRTQTGYRQRFSFYVVSDNMAGLDILSKGLEDILVGSGQAIDPRVWRVLQLNEVDFADEMVRVIDYSFYYKFS